MKFRLLVIALVLLSGGILLICSCGGDRRFVDKAIDYLQWSKDSQALFYSKSQNKLFRYDVKTGKKQTFDVPDRLVEFGVSPDGRFVMFPMVRNKTYGVYVMELNTKKIQKVFIMKNAVREFTTGVDAHGRRRTALESLKWITSISWLNPNNALLLVERPKGYSDVYLLDMRSNAFRELRRDVEDFSWTSDGSGFIYADASKRFRFYNLANKTDKLLDFGKLDIGEMGFLYISKHQIVFTYNKPKLAAKVLDLATMAIKPISLPEIESVSYISYDLSRCLTGSHAHPSALYGGWVSNEVYVMDLPKQTVQQLRLLEQKPLPAADASRSK